MGIINYWTDRNVFVTGCTGLLGSWVVSALVRRGANVTGLIRDAVPKSNLNLSTLNVVHGNLEDLDILERTVNEYEIDTIFHLGAQTIVGTANRNPLSTFETNIRGTWNILEACRRTSTAIKVVVASSDKAYGTQVVLPYDESLPIRAQHPYDVSKSCADLIAQMYFQTYKQAVCVTRCGNFYGGGDLNWNRLVPGTIRSIIRGEAPIIRSDGKFLRDYVYILDAVEAYLFLAEKMANSNIHGEAFNFSTNDPQTVLQMTNTILELMDREDLHPIVQNQASNEIREQYLSCEKAKRVLGWSSRYSLRLGLSETIVWYKEFFRG